MKKTYYTYKKSGVNIGLADKLVKYISKASKKTEKKQQNSKSFQNIGSFGAIYDLSRLKYKNPIIVSSTDGVGTKIEVANKIKKFNTIGIDLVAMCVNDLIVQGAKPLFFLDYISIEKLDAQKIKDLINGIIKGCKISGCSLVGGETAEMPGTYTKGKFDIAGFSVGIVEKNKLLVKSKIKTNNIVLAVPSSGLHSNGFSLVRKVLSKKVQNKDSKKYYFSSKTLNKELIKPTKIYVKEILALNDKKLINGCANITGGGLIDNIIRVIPNNHVLNIDLGKIKTKKIFSWLKNKGIKDEEMINTFNCGVGFCLIVEKKNISKIKNYFSKEFKPYEIGYISKGNMLTNIYGKIRW